MKKLINNIEKMTFNDIIKNISKSRIKTFIVAFSSGLFFQYINLLTPCLCFGSSKKIESYFPFVLFLAIVIPIRVFFAIYKKDYKACFFYNCFYFTGFLWITCLYNLFLFIKDGEIYF